MLLHSNPVKPYRTEQVLWLTSMSRACSARGHWEPSAKAEMRALHVTTVGLSLCQDTNGNALQHQQMVNWNYERGLMPSKAEQNTATLLLSSRDYLANLATVFWPLTFRQGFECLQSRRKRSLQESSKVQGKWAVLSKQNLALLALQTSQLSLAAQGQEQRSPAKHVSTL